jgi:2-polyprenyl-3-methyl-5-hydroxy-6-metoxy-1,4-benzoquinol methylase
VKPRRVCVERAPEVCISCGKRDKVLLIEKDRWKVYRCVNCDLGFLDPRPSQEEIGKLYKSAYFEEQYDKGLEIGSKALKKRLSSEKHRVKFVASVSRSGRLLDIGCGYGYYLYASRLHGYDVTGLEISEWASHYAVQRLKLPVRTGEILKVDLPENYFDIITMWHFLEHTQDPGSVLLRTKKWLKKNGILVIDVPNCKGTDAHYLWEDWDGWQLPYHFWHFNPHSMKALLEKYRFRVIKYKDYHSEVIKKKLSPIGLLKPFARLVSKMYSGTSFAIVAVLHNSG